MIIHNVQQNTPEWLELRRKKITASKCPALLMKDDAKGYTDLVEDVVEECITDKAVEGKWEGNANTDRGHDLEAFAIKEYELLSFEDVIPVGFVELNSWVGCSPDGFIGVDKLIQVKCPIFKTQRKYLKTFEGSKDLSQNEIMYKLDSNYYKQLQFELYVTGRRQNILYSYHPNLDDIMLTVERDDKMIQQIQDRLIVTINRIKTELAELKRMVA